MTTTIERVGRALAVTFLLLVVSASNAADAPSVTTDYAKASALHRDGRYDEGFRDILRPLSESYPRDTNIRFLFGLSAIKVSRLAQTSEAQQQALLDEAIAALHVILVDQPELVRVRLELARAFFYKEEDTLSRGHFERVLAGDVPKAVKANGQRFLTQLRARRRCTMYMGAALLPDNNLGSGSEDEVIYINFGGIDLPFRRNNADNLTTSGVGTLLWAGASISTPSETGCGCAPARIFRGRNTRAGSSTISTCRFMPGCAGCWTGAPKQACSPARAVAGRAPASIMTQWVGASRPGIGSHRGSRRTPRLPGTGATTLWTDPWSTSP